MYLLKRENYGEIPKRVELNKVIEILKQSNYQYVVSQEPSNKTYFDYDYLLNLTSSISVDEAIENVMKEYTGACISPGCPPVYTLSNGDPGYPGEDPEFDLPNDEMYRDEFEAEYAELLLKEVRKKEKLCHIPIDPYSLEISNEDRFTLFEVADKAYEDEYGKYPSTEDIYDKYVCDLEPDYYRD